MPRWPALTAEQRFWNKVDKSGECWIWTGARRGKGPLCAYGSFRAVSGQIPVKAHRYSWELAYGPIPADWQVMHRCDNPPCVNPQHLCLGTNAENVHDSSLKGRRHTTRNAGAKNGLAKLSEADVRDMRERYATGGVSIAALAAEHGATYFAAWRVIRGNGWKTVRLAHHVQVDLMY